MKVKHKLLSDYQYITSDKKIFIIKSNTILEDYCFKAKGDNIYIDRDIIDVNPEIFQIIDWKMELLSWLKLNKIPQPSVLSKKLIPFIDEMIISSMTPVTTTTVSDINILQEVNSKELMVSTLKKELDFKSSDLDLREKRIKDKEDEIQIRLSMIEKREQDYKLNLQQLNDKDDELRSKYRELSTKDLELNIRNNEINEKEREVSKNVLLSTNEIDNKYKELQDKINIDMSALKTKEKEIEKSFKELKELETKLENTRNDNIDIKTKIYQDLENELRGMEEDINNLYRIANTMKNFNHPIIMEASEELISNIVKLKNRIDNNIIN